MTSAADIKHALRAKYAAPEWALLFEVGDATGARHTRFADALAMSLWPSRGLTLHGMEIKISRSDWKKERAQPEKAETIAAYCDYWSLVTTKGVVSDPDEIPPSWGWLEFDGTKFVRRKDETRTDAKPIERTFLAALLRRAANTNEALIEIEAKRKIALIEESFESRVELAASNKVGRISDAAKIVEEFEQASGIKIDRWYGNHQPAKVGRVLKAVLQSGVSEDYQGLFNLSDQLRAASDRIEQAMVEQGFERPAAHKRGRR
jgi:hypothetical protein